MKRFKVIAGGLLVLALITLSSCGNVGSANRVKYLKVHPNVNGLPNVLEYDVETYSTYSNSTCIEVSTTDNQYIHATSYIIVDDTIYIKY